MIKEKLQAIKRHLIEYKEVYIPVAVGVASASITFLIMRERHAGVPRVPDGSDEITVRSSLLFSGRNNIVTVIEREGRGHPGYLIRCLETGETWGSQNEAAQSLGTYPSVISGHLHGKLLDVHGKHLERIGEVPA